MNGTTQTALAGFSAGMSLGRLRLARRALALVCVLALSAAAAIAWLEGNALPFDAASRALSAVVSIVIPLSCFTISNIALGATRLDDGTWSLARFGLPRRQLVLGVIVAAMVAGALLSLATVELTLAIAYRGRPGWMSDVLPSASIALSGATAYVAWFCLAASFGKRGRWVWAPLLADFWLGDGGGAFAVIWPRAHLINLVGGDAVMGLPQRHSSVLLVAMALVLACVAALANSDG